MTVARACRLFDLDWQVSNAQTVGGSMSCLHFQRRIANRIEKRFRSRCMAARSTRPAPQPLPLAGAAQGER
jgi:hypothetical protein